MAKATKGESPRRSSAREPIPKKLNRKNAQLLHDFKDFVARWDINAEGNPAAINTLVAMYKAVQAILDGMDPDAALGISRMGRPKKREQSELAFEVYRLRQAGHKDLVIEQLANDWLQARGLRPHGPGFALARIIRRTKQVGSTQPADARSMSRLSERHGRARQHLIAGASRFPTTGAHSSARRTPRTSD